MTNEEKQILLKDLCARLPYGVMIQTPAWLFGGTSKTDDVLLDSIRRADDGLYHFTDDFGYTIEHIKPYLRPMSSMTEEEKEEWENLDDYCILDDETKRHDFLISHHFDYRGLIEKGLAIAVTEENNPYKN